MPTQAERDARFMKSVLAASEDCIKVLDLSGNLTFMSEGGQRVMEVADFGAIKGCPWPEFWEGPNNAEARAAVSAAREGKSYRFQGDAKTAAGNERYWDVQVSPIFDANGEPEAILSVSRDITKLREEQEKYRLLANELNHRIKNALAMVQAIVHQTLRLHGNDIENAKEQLNNRMRALGQAQDMLMASTKSETTLYGLTVKILEPYGLGERVHIDGPLVRLAPRAAVAFALAIHELATNSLKYGALSEDTGAVHLIWSFDQARFHLSWIETGGPPVTPPTRRGFGSQVIEKALSGYLSGRATIDYAPEGVRVTVDAPMYALLAKY